MTRFAAAARKLGWGLFSAISVVSGAHIVVASSDGNDSTIGLESQIPALMEDAGVHGLSVAVVEGGELTWSDAFGVASTEPQSVVSRETIFEAASLGKVVFAFIVLRLVDRGRIDLDESIAESFGYPLLDHDDRFRKLTPRLILQHASGLPNWGGYALAKEREPVQFKAEPGSGYQYSGEAYTALQAFVEQRTGRSLEDHFADLASEADMKNSSFLSHRSHTEQYSKAWNADGSQREILVFEKPGAAYSLISTAEDLARFMAFCFHDGRLSDRMFQEFVHPINPVAPDAWGAHIPQGAHISWSLAWGVQQSPDGRVLFHGGNNGAFRSFIAYSVEHDVGVALMANGSAGLGFLPEVFTPFVGDIVPVAVWWGYETSGSDE